MGNINMGKINAKRINVRRINMKSIRKKKLIYTAVPFICVAVIGSTTYAADEGRRDEIVSHGKIVYGNNSVVIDAEDLIELADRADAVETSFKTDIAGALAGIKTFIQADGGISHVNQADINPRQVVFGALTAAILKSQSVEHLAQTRALASGIPVYYKLVPNNIVEVTVDDTGMPVYIRLASEDNLTAETAAWADGRCIVGNGSDNYYFYQKGFIEGYAAKVGASVEYKYDDTGRIESATLVFP